MDENFLDGLVRVITSRREATVLCLVCSEVGLELVMNTSNMVMQLGMLDVGRLEILDREARYREEHEEELRKAGVIAMSVLQKPGKAN